MNDKHIKVSKETHMKLKMQALKVGLTLKEYLERIAEKFNK